MGWIALHPVEPSWVEGATRLVRQLVGMERMVPTPAEVSQQPSAKRHMVRAFRESFKRIQEKHQPSMDYTSQEAQLRVSRWEGTFLAEHIRRGLHNVNKQSVFHQRSEVESVKESRISIWMQLNKDIAPFSQGRSWFRLCCGIGQFANGFEFL